MSEVQAQAQEATPIINILKLISGEEVIAEIAIEKLESGEIVHLVNPYAVIRQVDEKGNLQVGVMPMADLTATGSVQVNTAHIVYTAAPKDEFLQHYQSKVNPPLIETPPEKKLIVPQGA